MKGPRQARFDRNKLQLSAYFLTSTDSKRTSGKDKRSIEFESNLKSMFASLILSDSLEHSEIEIHAQVLHGSTESAAINVISLALVHDERLAGAARGRTTPSWILPTQRCRSSEWQWRAGRINWPTAATTISAQVDARDRNWWPAQ